MNVNKLDGPADEPGGPTGMVGFFRPVDDTDGVVPDEDETVNAPPNANVDGPVDGPPDDGPVYVNTPDGPAVNTPPDGPTAVTSGAALEVDAVNSPDAVVAGWVGSGSVTRFGVVGVGLNIAPEYAEGPAPMD